MAKKYRRAHRLSRLRNLSMHWYGFIFFIAIAVFLVALDRIKPEVTTEIKQQLIGYAVPVLDILSKPAQSFGDAVKVSKNFIETNQQNQKMRQEILDLRQKADEISHLRTENKALREILNLQEDQFSEFITARIVADTSWQFYRTVLVNVGSKHGIKRDMYAMADGGLIGRIIEVGDNYARVLLLQDWASRIPVTIADTEVRAIIAGRNTTTTQLIHLTGGNLTDLKRNMTVMTSGRGGVFPPGIPIGRLQIAEDGTVDAESLSRYSMLPYSDPDKMTFVKIYPNSQPIVIPKDDQ